MQVQRHFFSATFLVALAYCCLSKAVGCSSTSDPETVKVAIKAAIPRASGVPNEEWEHARAEGMITPRKFRTKPLSLLLYIPLIKVNIPELPERIDECKAEFQYVTDSYPSTERRRAVFERSVGQGYRAMIHADQITNLTCDLEGATASGKFSFEVPELCRGTFEYSAVRVGSQWQITEFRMPAHDWSFVRRDDGRWSWCDFFGDVDAENRFLPRHAVTGQVLLDGEPLSGANVRLTHIAAVTVPQAPTQREKTNPQGRFSMSLPGGTYSIDVHRSRPPLTRGNYRTRDGSELLVDIGEGENHLMLNLVSHAP
jgi:hypothetical protein